MEQIVWTAFNLTFTSVDSKIIRSALTNVGLVFLSSALWILVVFRFTETLQRLNWALKHPKEMWDFIKERLLNGLNYVSRGLEVILKYANPVLVSVFLFVLSVVLAYSSYHKLDKKFNITNWAMLQHEAATNDFFEKAYRVPALSQIAFEKKKNLIVVLNESLETTWMSQKIEGAPLMPGLENQLKTAQHVNNFHQSAGASWTAGAATSWCFGIPLKLPINANSYHSRRGYLPNAQGIFDVLASNGYKTVLILGSDKEFAGQYNLFGQHGNFVIKDRNYWKSKGYSLIKDGGTGWGFNDKFVLERAYEEYERLSKETTPFVIFVETIDLHAPNGYAPPDMVFHNDIRDVVRWNDIVADEFISKVKPKLGAETVLAYIGDHNFMGNPPQINGIPRRIFNGFWGDVPKIPESKRNEIVTAVDIAPTLLEATGARWNDRQYGIGVSLFSDTPSLAQKIGMHQFNQEISRRSARYQKFY